MAAPPRFNGSGVGFRSKDSRLLMTQGGLSKFMRQLPKEAQVQVKAEVNGWAATLAGLGRAFAPMASSARKVKGREIQPGMLKRSIRYAVFNKGFTAQAGIWGQMKELAYYAYFVHYGTKPHLTTKKGRSLGRILRRNGGDAAGQHPGTDAKPFMQQAATAAGPEGARRVVSAIRAALRAAASGANSSTYVDAEQMLQKLNSDVQVLKQSEMNVAVGQGRVEQ